MTHYDAETLEEVAHEALAERYEHYLDEVLHPDGVTIEGVELVPSEVLKTVDPVAYEEEVYNYINALYDAGELTSEWDREDTIKELCNDWAFTVLGEILDHTTTQEDETIYSALYRLCERGVLVLDSGEITLSSDHSMSEVLISLGSALNEKNN